jgi:hypothetical protein
MKNFKFGFCVRFPYSTVYRVVIVTVFHWTKWNVSVKKFYTLDEAENSAYSIDCGV